MSITYELPVVVQEARDFAMIQHSDQCYGIHPYIFHLDDVVKLVRHRGNWVQIVAYLHDVLEDTDTSTTDIQRKWGTWVLNQVLLLTDPKGSRKERHAGMSARFLRHKDDPYFYAAFIVKAADRCCNIQQGSKNKMYLQEQDSFKTAVFISRLCDELWKTMDRVLYGHDKDCNYWNRVESDRMDCSCGLDDQKDYE